MRKGFIEIRVDGDFEIWEEKGNGMKMKMLTKI